MSNPSFICVTNIPSPYRIDEFTYLDQEFSLRGINFEVIFMAPSEEGRSWKYDSSKYSFKSRVAPGLHPRIGNFEFHFNVGLLFDLLKRKPDWILIGGGWSLPTSISISTGMKLLRPNCPVLFWVEATPSSPVFFQGKGLKGLIKRFFLNIYDGYVVPGQSSKMFLETLEIKNKPMIKLSNFIDSGFFREGVNKAKNNYEEIRNNFNVSPDEIVLLCPARLIPQKGILEFLEKIGSVINNRTKILLAGDGCLRKEIESYIINNNINYVYLLGHQSIEKMLELYAISDLLLLPSISETYGFVCVEALWSGLPILISKKVGAISEVLVEEKNGWSFDPQNEADVKSKFQKATSIDSAELKEMGNYSLKLADENFNIEASANLFVRDLLARFPIPK